MPSRVPVQINQHSHQSLFRRKIQEFQLFSGTGSGIEYDTRTVQKSRLARSNSPRNCSSHRAALVHSNFRRAHSISIPMSTSSEWCPRRHGLALASNHLVATLNEYAGFINTTANLSKTFDVLAGCPHSPI